MSASPDLSAQAFERHAWVPLTSPGEELVMNVIQTEDLVDINVAQLFGEREEIYGAVLQV